MDIAANIKRDIISKIKESNDIDFLKALNNLIDASASTVYQLNPEQQEAIQFGREQIKKGDFIEHDEFISETKEWLGKK